MEEQENTRPETLPEVTAHFVVIVQGTSPHADVVQGLEAVREAVLQAVWRLPEDARLGRTAALVASLDDPESWASHGHGDGRPYWHWWFGYEGGSVTVQRLTGALPSQAEADHLRATLADAVGVLADCAQDLRRLGGMSGGSGGGGGGYVFSAQHRPPARQGG